LIQTNGKNNRMSLTEPHLSNIYEFDLEVGKGMSLNVTFNGDWENRVIVRNITCDKEIGRISGKLGTEGTLTYDNPHQCAVKIQCVFEHRKPNSIQWEKDKYIIREDHPTFKKVGCEDGGDKNFTDLVMFVCITQKEKSCMSNENCPPDNNISSECQTHLAGLVKVSTDLLKEVKEIDVRDTESVDIILENIGPCQLTLEGIALSKAIYRTNAGNEYDLEIITLSPDDGVKRDYGKPVLVVFYQDANLAHKQISLAPGNQLVLKGNELTTRLHPHIKDAGKLSLFYKFGSITITGTNVISNPPDDENQITVNKE
jgi:hypothetical protein